jgi:hypothetical protein
MARIPKNLSLDPDAVARGQRYGRRYGKSLSQLVNDLLHSLPEEPRVGKLSPIVRRLAGVAAGGKADRETYRQHLYRKYGRR